MSEPIEYPPTNFPPPLPEIGETHETVMARLIEEEASNGNRS